MNIWLQHLWIVCPCKCPADIACRVTNMRPDRTTTPPLIIHQSIADQLYNGRQTVGQQKTTTTELCNCKTTAVPGRVSFTFTEQLKDGRDNFVGQRAGKTSGYTANT